MSGRYGKYGEVKRLTRLRQGRKHSRLLKSGPQLRRDYTRKESSPLKRFRNTKHKEEGE